MAGGWDEVQQGVYSVIFEARVTLNPRLHCQDVIVLPLQVTHNLLKTKESAVISVRWDR